MALYPKLVHINPNAIINLPQNGVIERDYFFGEERIFIIRWYDTNALKRGEFNAATGKMIKSEIIS